MNWQFVKKPIFLVGCVVCAICIGLILAWVLRDKDVAESLEDAGYIVEETEIYVEGLKEEYTFVYLSDYHLLEVDDSVNEKDREMVEARHSVMHLGENPDAGERWMKMIEEINESNPHAVLFGGDLIDFASKKNIDLVKAGIDELEVPHMYVRADHDLEPWWCDEKTTPEQVKKYHAWSEAKDGIFKMEFPEFIVVGWDNSTAQMTDTTLAKMVETFDLGKPVILLTHVPINSKVDKSMLELSNRIWGRNLTWDSANNAHYVPNESTAYFLNEVLDKDSPVRGILSGHLHHTWDGMINEGIKGHVFGPAYEGAIGVVTITGEQG